MRNKIRRVAAAPRLSVFRSLCFTYAQLIDDAARRTLAAASSRNLGKGMKKVDAARAVGALIAEQAAKVGVKAAVLDRGSYRYHGRVRALVEAAREKGLKV